MSDYVPKVLRWEQPGPRQRAVGRADWEPVASALIARPGEWALIASITGKVDSEERRLNGVAKAIRTGNIRAFSPPGAFESTSRLQGDETKLYARYVADTPKSWPDAG